MGSYQRVIDWMRHAIDMVVPKVEDGRCVRTTNDPRGWTRPHVTSLAQNDFPRSPNANDVRARRERNPRTTSTTTVWIAAVYGTLRMESYEAYFAS